MESNHDSALIIGIDFGTTFTGVAYESIKPGNQGQADITPQPITLWPAPQGTDFDTAKVPSQIAYTTRGATTWGQQASEKLAQEISWFKLLLLDEHDLPSHLSNSTHIQQARERMEKAGKDVVTLISDYLAKVWDHALRDITRARSRDFVNRPFHVVITVPAIWQDYAVQQMKLALKKAGVLNKRPGCADTTHAFVSEPEAAALAAIEGHKKYDTLKPGETFVVADLGGGTVDLISFRVHAIQPQIALEEIVEGEGALCGATFLDQAFLACLEKKLSKKKEKERSLKSWKQMHVLERNRIMDIVWEKGIKRKYYDGQPAQRIDLGAQGNRRPNLILEPDELNEVFDSVYKDISKLIGGQVEAIVNKTGKFIVMNGGFGRCEYIYRKLQEQYEDRIEILCERNDKPWTAVARGAVLSGAAHLNNQDRIHSHVSRYSYGWVKWEDFNHRVHDLDDHDVHELTGYSVAKDQMEWIILRGESVETRKPRVYEYERFFDIDEVGFVSFSEPLYRSNLSHPPRRLVENEAKEEHPNGGDEIADFQNHVIIDMETPVPVQALPRAGGKEFPHRKLIYRVDVNVSGASLVIKATSQGKNIGEKIISGLSE
ncbi:hypothetical protein HD806DRAFT_533717 [Xylariaceae sp. AK1471]|nr:hypothetical protein HD806DRAFT_533717 [Xylariaceae sp. AK1471]